MRDTLARVSGTARAPLGGMEGDLFLSLFAVAQRMRRELRDFARAKRMSVTELLALHLMAETAHAWDAASLARRLGCSRIHGFRISERLVQLELAHAEIDPRNTSYRPIFVTERGRETYACAVDALDAQCFDYLSPEDKRELHRLVSRMRRPGLMRLLVD